MEPFSFFVFFASFMPLASKARLNSNPLWKSDVHQPLQDRLDVAFLALLEGTTQVPAQRSNYMITESKTGHSQFFAAMAAFDIASHHNDTFRELASQYFKVVLLSTDIQDTLDRGYTAIRWYKACGDKIFLEDARRNWERANQVTISKEITSPNGTIPGKSFRVNTSCQVFKLGNITLEGATFREGASYLNKASDDGVLSLYETALFSLLSALLAEAEPSEAKYVRAATRSLNFIFRMEDQVLESIREEIKKPLEDMYLDWAFLSMTGQGCDQLSVLRDNYMGSTGGVLIQAISVMRSISGSEDMDRRLQELINSTFYPTITDDHNSGGILYNKNETRNAGPLVFGRDGDMYLLRGPAEVYRRGGSSLPVDLRDNVKAFLGVHYNAIQNLATPGNNIYARNWTGPKPTQVTFDFYNQAAAAQILADGIGILNDSDSTLSESPSSFPKSGSSKPPTVVIAGATVGSATFVLLAVLVFLYTLRRRRDKSRGAPSSDYGPTARVIVPFVNTTFEKRTAFPYKYPLPESQARVVVPQAPLVPLRRHNSAPSTFQQGRESPNEHHRITGFSDTNTEAIASEDRGHVHTGGDMGTDLTMPEMVRAIYQRLWIQNELGNPPDYRSDTGESQRVRDVQ
ncbi:hypothetical protein PM082_014457 [Marasmius tenuissimus]|nr:hypothetical protein PM082_014457 [Marasmius tenuissimus]